MFEATVMMPRALRRFRIDFAQISQHRFDRSVQTIKIEPVKAAFPIFERLLIVVLAQPADEIEDIGIAPHPLREPFETAQRFHAIDVVARAANEPIDAIGVRPICFHRDGVEAALRDQPFGNLRANPVKLVRAVTRFADQNEARITD